MGSIARTFRHHGNLPAYAALSIENSIHDQLRVKMDDAADVPGKATQTVGFQLVAGRGDLESKQKIMVELEFGVFKDPETTKLADGPAGCKGILHTATQGKILDHEKSAAVVIQTDKNGRFQCTLHRLTLPKCTLFVSADEGVAGPTINCLDFDSVSF